MTILIVCIPKTKAVFRHFIKYKIYRRRRIVQGDNLETLFEGSNFVLELPEIFYSRNFPFPYDDDGWRNFHQSTRLWASHCFIFYNVVWLRFKNLWLLWKTNKILNILSNKLRHYFCSHLIQSLFLTYLQNDTWLYKMS